MDVLLVDKLGSRTKGRYDKIKDYCVSIAEYGNIINSNSHRELNEIDIIGVDTSLRGTAICFSIPYEDEGKLEILHNYIEALRLLFKARINDYHVFQDYLKQFKLNFSYEYKSSENLSYNFPMMFNEFVRLLFNNNVFFYDSVNSRIIFIVKCSFSDNILQSETVRLKLIDDIFRFFACHSNLFKYLNFLFTCSYALMNEAPLAFLSDKENERLFDLMPECSRIFKLEDRELRPVFCIEEINSAKNFNGLRANSMVFGLMLNAFYDSLIQNYMKSNNKFRGLIFASSKSSLKSFLNKAFKDSIELISIESNKKISPTKINQIKTLKMFSGFEILDDDAADSFCYALYCINLYESLIHGLKLLKETELIVESKDNSIKFSGFWEEKNIDVTVLKDLIDSSYQMVGEALDSHYLNLETIRRSLYANYMSKNIWI